MPFSRPRSRPGRATWGLLAITALIPSSGCVAAVAAGASDQVAAGAQAAGARGAAGAGHSLEWGECPPTPTVRAGQSGARESPEPPDRPDPADDPLQCADLEVPVDHEKPDGRTITLKLGRLPATGESEGSVLVAYGGPGGPGIELTRQSADSWSELRTRMDIITWDTRGYGEQFGGLSEGLPCSWTRLPVPEVPADEAAFDRMTIANRAYANMCRSRDPEFFDNMSSADHARDMEAIRQALGEPRLNFYGASYAGIYAQTYGRLFPDRVRTMVLDGSGNHATTDIRREHVATARTNDQAMQRFFDWCRDRDSCAISDRPERQWQRLLKRADREPIRAESNGYHYQAVHLQTFGLSIARSGQDGWPALAKAIRRGLAGDVSGLVDAYGEPYPGVGTPVTECPDWPRPRSAEELRTTVEAMREASPSTGAAGTLAVNLMQCAGWPVAVTNPPEPLPTGLPPLLGAGARGEDEATWRAISGVPDSALISYDGPGHTLYQFNECAREHINRYLTDRVLPDTENGKVRCPA